MLDNVPNLIYFCGYTNASWTLRCEMTSDWASKIICHMDKVGAKQFYPYLAEDHSMNGRPLLELSSGYLTRAKDKLPKLGDKGSWSHYSYMSDYWSFSTSKVNDDVMRFE